MSVIRTIFLRQTLLYKESIRYMRTNFKVLRWIPNLSVFRGQTYSHFSWLLFPYFFLFFFIESPGWLLGTTEISLLVFRFSSLFLSLELFDVSWKKKRDKKKLADYIVVNLTEETRRFWRARVGRGQNACVIARVPNALRVLANQL